MESHLDAFVHGRCLGGVQFRCVFGTPGSVSDTIRIERVGFSGDGWYEFIAINSKDDVAMQKAKDMLDQLLDYPILDETAFSEAEEEYYTSIGYVQNDSGEWVAQSEAPAPSP